jgi:hypothetical protein
MCTNTHTLFLLRLYLTAPIIKIYKTTNVPDTVFHKSMKLGLLPGINEVRAWKGRKNCIIFTFH